MKTKEELKTELETLKSKYGNSIHVLEVPTNDEETEFATIYLKKADRLTHSIVWKLYAQDANKAIESCVRTNYIGGDDLEMILKDDDMFLSLESAIVDYLRKRTARIKKN